ncbi:MAG: phosphotyrosine protein phosphatase [Bacteroidota bacterium]
MNILFVCSGNKHRSLTAEDYFSAIYSQHSFASAGTNITLCQKEGTTPISEELVLWADFVLVMEERHRKEVRKLVELKHGTKVTVLGIPDRFRYYEKKLIQLLQDKIEGIL